MEASSAGCGVSTCCCRGFLSKYVKRVNLDGVKKDSCCTFVDSNLFETLLWLLTDRRSMAEDGKFERAMAGRGNLGVL